MRNAAYLQSDIEANNLSNSEIDVALDDALKSFLLKRDRVFTDLQIGEAVIAGGVGGRRGRSRGLDLQGGDGDTRNSRAGRIADRTDDARGCQLCKNHRLDESEQRDRTD